jgi:Ca2+-binding RTX toxin-like protein
MSGGDGDDIVHGGSGDDTIFGSVGDDELFGDSGNDLFVFGDVNGNVTVDGGGGSWTDVLEVDLDGGPAGSLSSGSWTLEIDGQTITSDDAHGSIDTEGHSGTIHTDHGSIDFDNIDKIEW